MPDIMLDNVTLPEDLEWTDEFDWSPVDQIVTPTLTGALDVEETALLAGRLITLATGDGVWVSRATLMGLQELLTPGRTMVLSLADGRQFNVAWRYQDKPIEARPVVFASPSQDDDDFAVTLRLLEV